MAINTPSVLVIDDDPGMLHLLEVVFRKNGMTGEMVRSAEVAASKLRERTYDTLLLDLAMPGLSGFDFLGILERSHPELLKKTIVVTGLDPSRWDGFDPARIWGVVRKPFEPSRLVRSIRLCANGEGEESGD